MSPENTSSESVCEFWHGTPPRRIDLRSLILSARRLRMVRTWRLKNSKMMMTTGQIRTRTYCACRESRPWL